MGVHKYKPLVIFVVWLFVGFIIFLIYFLWLILLIPHY